MLSDEEKRAIDKLKRSANYFVMPIYETKIILELIEKQSKEIEELTDKNKKLKDKAKELIFEKQELTSGLLDSTPNDKIKAKIEIRKEEKENCKDSIEEKYLLREIYVLQSLLEKEE